MSHATSTPAPLADPTRLDALHGLGLGLSEDTFDRASRLASRALGTPVALVSIVFDDRQVFAGQHGLGEPWSTTRQTPLTHSFCQHVVLADAPMVVEDARRDARVLDNLAIDDLGVVAYLGLPLYGPGEQVVGSFCVIDSTPRTWSASDVEVLADVALGVQRELDLRSTIRELNEARRERDNLVQALAHDIRSPLTTVMAGAEMLARPGLDAEQRSTIGGAVTRQSQRLVAMALRLLGEPDGESGFSERQPVAEVVNAVVLARSIAGHGQRLVLDVGEGTDVEIPAEAVSSIVTNLVDNALNHTRGRVHVKVERHGEELVLVVADDGPGYDPAAVDDGRQAPRGFGLGRGIVAHHVAELGGAHDVVSAPGRGTTATIRLPLPP